MSFSGAYRHAIQTCNEVTTNGDRSAPAQCGFAGCLALLRVARTQACGRVNYIFGMPPPGIIEPMPRIILAIPPLVENFFIIFCICLCCLIKRPMSCT